MRLTAILAWLSAPGREAVRVALVAPVLLFPQVRPSLTLAVGVVWAALTFAAWLRGAPAFPFGPLRWPALGLAAMVLVGTLVTPFPDLALPKATGVLLGLLVLRLILWQVQTASAVRAAVGLYLLTGFAWLAAGTAATAWLGKFSLLAQVTALLPRIVRALPGTAPDGVHPNAIGGTTLFFVPLLFALILWGFRPPRAGVLEDPSPALPLAEPLGNRERVVVIALFAFSGTLLLLSQSRTSWFAAGLVLGLLTVVRFRPSRRVVAAGALLALAGAAAVAPVFWPSVRAAFSSFGSRLAPTEVTFAVRVELWSSALAAIGDFPWTGTGLNAFRRLVHLLYPPLQMSREFDVAHCHNVFLQTALDVGLPGLLAYLALFGVTAALAARALRRVSGPDAGLVWGCTGSLLAVHAFGLADAIVLGAKVGLFLWVDIGLIAAVAGMAGQSSPVRAAAAPPANTG